MPSKLEYAPSSLAHILRPARATLTDHSPGTIANVTKCMLRSRLTKLELRLGSGLPLSRSSRLVHTSRGASQGAVSASSSSCGPHHILIQDSTKAKTGDLKGIPTADNLLSDSQGVPSASQEPKFQALSYATRTLRPPYHQTSPRHGELRLAFAPSFPDEGDVNQCSRRRDEL